ncbi:MAG: condensation domain-containing protein [Blastocatellia bacterium]
MPPMCDDSESVAIIGMSARFPGSRSVEQFWEGLKSGVEAVHSFSDEELLKAGTPAEFLTDPRYVKAGLWLEDVDQFDAQFFGISPREAEITDPQHRLFLECAWESLEAAGYDPQSYQGAIGVYAGASLSSYLASLFSNESALAATGVFQAVVGNDKDYLPTRVSYKLNLRGPSVCVQTACSTSLVAVHLACQGLLNGECDMALAGGVTIGLLRKTGYWYQRDGIISPDGHCRPFDSNAQGTIGGSGVGVVVLKRLADALESNDNIQAIIRGSAINNDGGLKIGYTAPSIEGQAAVIKDALTVAGVEPETISYVEAHGTATALGDPIEVAALTRAFRTSKRGFCALGSVKSNIGHAAAAAGVAGLIKAALALKHREIPPSLHFVQPNPRIDFAHSPFYVNTRLSEWKSDGSPRRAGVSSFGIGGTNAHVVLEEPPSLQPLPAPRRPIQLLLLSAKTKPALEKMSENLAEYLRQVDKGVEIADVAYTLQVGRRRFPHRRAVICSEPGEAAESLKAGAAQSVLTEHSELTGRPVVFLFPGQGAQYLNMGRVLYEQESIFREQMDLCAELLKPSLGIHLRSAIYGDGKHARQLSQTWLTQPALFSVEYSLARMWVKWGVTPSAMIGHSIGEYVAACLSGVFSLEDALRLVAERGRRMQEMPEGAMLAIRRDANLIEPLLGKDLWIAASNAPSSSVVAGSTRAIERLMEELNRQGVQSRRLSVSHAFHSGLMESMVEGYAQEVARVELREPKIPYLSNVTGAWIEPGQATDPYYWGQHVRERVRFHEGLSELMTDPERVLLEVGPGTTLATLARQSLNGAAPPTVLHTIGKEPERELHQLHQTLGRLWLSGVEIDWAAFWQDEQRRRIPLPTYPFERKSYWIDPHGISRKEGEPAKPESRESRSAWLYSPWWKRTPLVADNDSADKSDTWLIFEDRHGVGARLVEGLSARGRAIRVQEGEQWQRTINGDYYINPDRPEDYERLVEDLAQQGHAPGRIVHLWSLNASSAEADDLATFNRNQGRCFNSLLLLAKAISLRPGVAPVQFDVISNEARAVTGEENLHPQRATVSGACAAIEAIHPNYISRLIDMSLPPADSDQHRALTDSLLREVLSQNKERVVALRGRHRWIEHSGRLEFDEADPRAEGVYLIAGQASRMGHALARYLAENLNSRVILLNDSSSPAATPQPNMRPFIDADGLNRRRDGARAGAVDQAHLTEAESSPHVYMRELCCRYVHRYLESGLSKLSRAACYSKQSLREALNVAPVYHKLFDYMLSLMEEDNAVKIKGDDIEFLRENIPERIPALTRSLAERFPGMNDMVGLLDACFHRYEDVLSGDVPAVSLLFPDGNSTYDVIGHSAARDCCIALRDLIIDALKMRPGSHFRLLEVGAGTGFFTRLLAPLLEGLSVEYYFTDIGKSFVVNAERERQRLNYDFMRCRVLDISRDPVEQGMNRSSFDAVIGFNCLHVTKNIQQSLANLRKLLRPGGALCLVELVNAHPWIELIWGLTPEWWSFEDTALRTAPTLSTGLWRQVIEDCGFESIYISTEDDGEGVAADHAVLVASNGEATSDSGLDYDARSEWPGGPVTNPGDQAIADSYALSLNVDLNDESQVKSAIASAIGEFGRLDAIVYVRTGQWAREGANDSFMPAAGLPEDLAKIRALQAEAGRNSASLALLSPVLAPPGEEGCEHAPGYLSRSLFDAVAEQSSITGEQRTISISCRINPWVVANQRDEDSYIESGIFKAQDRDGSYKLRPDVAHTICMALVSCEAPGVVIVKESNNAKQRGPLAADDHSLQAQAGLDGQPGYQGEITVEEIPSDGASLYPRAYSDTEREVAAIWREVLGADDIGIDDEFSDLGGDSLIGLQVIARLRERLGVNLPLSSVFAAPTVPELARLVEAALTGESGETIEAAAPSLKMEKIEGKEPMALSFAQRRLWFLEQLFPNSSNYNIPLAFRITGRFNLPAFRQSIRYLVQRHESLRTTFIAEGGSPLQVVHPLVEVNVPVVAVGNGRENKEDEIYRLASEEAGRPFQLAHGPLIRLLILEAGQQEHVVVFTFHHIICDGWSFSIFFKELAIAYRAYCEGQAPDLPELQYNYRSYSDWQHKWISQGEAQSQLDYWSRQLGGVKASLNLRTDFASQQTLSFRGSNKSRMLSLDLKEKLRAFCRERSVSQFMALTAVYQLMLHCYTDDEEFLIGTPVANRHPIETKDIIGFFINVVALRADLSGDPTFGGLLSKVREVALGAYANQTLPFEKVVERLHPERTLTHAPLFRVVFGYYNIGVPSLELEGLSINHLNVSQKLVHSQLYMMIEEKSEGLFCFMEYVTDLFREATIIQMLDRYETLLALALANPQMRISDMKRTCMNDKSRQSTEARARMDELSARRLKSSTRVAVSVESEK